MTTVCGICPQACNLAEGQRGACAARICSNNKIIPENYGRVTSLALDPIEKKPLACFHAGSMVLSLGSYGCNLCCPFCQNASIAQVAGGRIPTMPAAPCSTDSLEKSLPGYEVIAPGKLVDLALQMRSRGNIGLAYTYNEPLVGYEFVRDCATRAHQNDLLNVLVTNGYINARPWQELLPLIDAVNIDLKGFTQDFYDRVCAPHGLQTVKRSIELAAATGTCHLEVTTLVISGINDSPAEIAALAAWLASVDPGIPLHITRFFPTYLMTDRPATPRKTIIDLVKVAQQHLQTVLPGNI